MIYSVELINFPIPYTEIGKFICENIEFQNVEISCWNNDFNAFKTLSLLNVKIIKKNEDLSFYLISKTEFISKFNTIFSSESNQQNEFYFFDLVFPKIVFSHYLTEIHFFDCDKNLVKDFTKMLKLNNVEFVINESKE